MFKGLQKYYAVGLDWDWFLKEVQSVIKPGNTLLDAGAGECKWRDNFTDCNYISLDYKVGDRSWDYRHIDIEADLNKEIPMPDESVDIVISIQVLEHLSNPQQALKELSRVLRPGGHIFLTTPFAYQEHQQPFDYYRYTRYGMQYLLEQANLSPLLIQPMGGYFMLLREYLSHFHTPVFYKHSPGLQILSWLPLQLIKILNLAILPPILYFLDSLDTEQTFTLGHIVHAQKQVAY
jgi:SAM-dependent methyltransferase